MQAGLVLHGFLLAFSAAMLAVMGWPLLAVPSRPCNAHMLTDKRLAGPGLLIAAALLVIGSLVRAMTARDIGMRGRISGHRTVL